MSTVVVAIVAAGVAAGIAFGASAEAEPEPEPGPIVFRSFEEAVAMGAAEDRVTIVYFTADWCGYCRKMEALSFGDPEVRRIAPRFTWAKVDVDDEPHIAARFGMMGVPALVFINARGELLEARPGYAGVDALATLLRANVDKSRAPGRMQKKFAAVHQTVLRLRDAQPGTDTDASVVEAVVLLSGTDASGRGVVQGDIVDLGERSRPGLVSCLDSERLAVRAAAFDLLLATTDVRIAFDPFAEPDARAAAAAGWRDWLESGAGRDPS